MLKQAKYNYVFNISLIYYKLTYHVQFLNLIIYTPFAINGIIHSCI